jgi:hypothetical protein
MKKLSKPTVELVIKLTIAMDELSKHWYELSDDEDELLSDNYPMGWRSFDEMSAECTKWLISLAEQNNG